MEQSMTQAEKALYRFVNIATRVLLHSPAHRILSSTTLVLTLSGRKSGKCYRIPVSYTTADESLICFTSSAWSDWWKNLRGGVPVMIRVNGRTCRGIATATNEGSEETTQNLYAFLQRFPTTAKRYHVATNNDGQLSFSDVVCAAQSPVTIMISLRLEGLNNLTVAATAPTD